MCNIENKILSLFVIIGTVCRSIWGIMCGGPKVNEQVLQGPLSQWPLTAIPRIHAPTQCPFFNYVMPSGRRLSPPPFPRVPWTREKELEELISSHSTSFHCHMTIIWPAVWPLFDLPFDRYFTGKNLPFKTASGSGSNVILLLANVRKSFG